MVGCLQAAGDIRTPMLVGIFECGSAQFRFPTYWVKCGIHWGWGLIGIWIAMATDEILRGLLFIYRWQSGKWKNKRLIEAINFYRKEKNMSKTVGIIGLGLLGGSLALALKAYTDYEVVGYARRQEICDMALADKQSVKVIK